MPVSSFLVKKKKPGRHMLRLSGWPRGIFWVIRVMPACVPVWPFTWPRLVKAGEPGLKSKKLLKYNRLTPTLS